MKKLIILISFYVLFAESQDVIYLNNGSIIKGEIVEQVINEYIKIKSGENTFVYNFDEVEKILKEEKKQKLSSEYLLSNLERRKNRALAIGLSTYGVTILADLAIDGYVENQILIPIVGPVLLSGEPAGEDYKSILLASSLLQLYCLYDFINSSNKIENQNFSYFINPLYNNPKVSFSFKF